jgi:hypothetical protein
MRLKQLTLQSHKFAELVHLEQQNEDPVKPIQKHPYRASTPCSTLFDTQKFDYPQDLGHPAGLESARGRLSRILKNARYVCIFEAPGCLISLDTVKQSVSISRFVFLDDITDPPNVSGSGFGARRNLSLNSVVEICQAVSHERA